MHCELPTTVFFDGLCPICSREVRLYRRLDRSKNIEWRDLNDGPATLAGETFSHEAAMTLLHVKDNAGRLHVGIDAHLCMWDQLPFFRVLAGVIGRRPIAKRLLEKGYIFFTRYRPGLSSRTPAGRGCDG